MLFLEELKCPQCKCEYESASELLKHFATHAIEELVINCESNGEKSQFNKKTIPDLRPIMKKIDNCPEENVNPLTLCEVTINDGKLNGNARSIEKLKFESFSSKKCKCLYCKKCFEWPTDLKRHLLSHTGEKPFKCNFCELSYTRKSILHKHIIKSHKKSRIPDLKPINTLLRMKCGRDSDKSI